MENSVFIARILGPCMLIVALGFMRNRGFYQRVMEDYCKNAFMVFFGGMLALIIGIVIVLCHNYWVAEWYLVITIYGWGAIIKGAWLLVFPNTVPKFMQAYQKNKALFTAHIVFVVLFGAYMTLFAYFPI